MTIKIFNRGNGNLFKELLEESLESGQKVVIYSQFLKMIQIMENYLAHEAIDFVSLTGKTLNREKIIQRFNDDPVAGYSWEASRPAAWASTWWPRPW